MRPMSVSSDQCLRAGLARLVALRNRREESRVVSVSFKHEGEAHLQGPDACTRGSHGP